MSKPKEIGTLVVVILKAQHLHQPSFYKQDPYAQVTLSGQTKKTKADSKGGQHPVWDEEFRFPVYADAGKDREHRLLEVACYKRETKGDDVLLGKGSVDVEETLKTGEFDDWVQLETSAGARGQLYIEMTFYANSPPPPTRRASKLMPADRLARPVSSYSMHDQYAKSPSNLSLQQAGTPLPCRPPLAGPRQRTSSQPPVPVSLHPRINSSSQSPPSKKDSLPPLPEDLDSDRTTSKRPGHLPTILRPGRGGRAGQNTGTDSRRLSSALGISLPDTDPSRRTGDSTATQTFSPLSILQTPLQEQYGRPPSIIVQESRQDNASAPSFPVPCASPQLPGAYPSAPQVYPQSVNHSTPYSSAPQPPSQNQYGYLSPGSPPLSRPLSQSSFSSFTPNPSSTPLPQEYPPNPYLPGTQSQSSSPFARPPSSIPPQYSAQQPQHPFHAPQAPGTPQPLQQSYSPPPPHPRVPSTPRPQLQTHVQYAPHPSPHPSHLTQSSQPQQTQQQSYASVPPPPPPPPPPVQSIQTHSQAQAPVAFSPPPPPPPLKTQGSSSPGTSPAPTTALISSTSPSSPEIATTQVPATGGVLSSESLVTPQSEEVRAQAESDIGPKPVVSEGASRMDEEEWERRVEAKKKEMEAEARRRLEEARKAEDERQRLAEEERKRREDEEKRIEEEARRRFEGEEAQRREQEEREKILQAEAEAEARKRIEEEERVKREAEEKRLREEQERKRREEEEQRQQEELLRQEREREEAERLRKLEEKRQKAERIRRLEEERLKREEEERKRQELKKLEEERQKRAEEEHRRRLEEQAEAERRWQEELARIRARAEQEAADAAFARIQFEAEEAERRRQEEADLAFARQAQEEAEREELLARERRYQEEADAEVARREQAHEEELERRRQVERRRAMEEADRELARRLEMGMNI